MKLINISKYIIIFLLSNICVFSQATEQQFKLAESYEQGGDLKSALRLYEEVYQSNKQEKYFEPIVRIYKQQNRYEELKPIVEERLKTHKNAKLFILAGEIYWHLGQFNDANKM
jgi:tetratricopeptide (TPR) repeat protein